MPQRKPMRKSAENGMVAVELEYHARELTVNQLVTMEPGKRQVETAMLVVHFLPPKYL